MGNQKRGEGERSRSKAKSVCEVSWAATMCFVRGNLNCYEVLYCDWKPSISDNLLIFLGENPGEILHCPQFKKVDQCISTRFLGLLRGVVLWLETKY